MKALIASDEWKQVSDKGQLSNTNLHILLTVHTSAYTVHTSLLFLSYPHFDVLPRTIGELLGLKGLTTNTPKKLHKLTEICSPSN